MLRAAGVIVFDFIDAKFKGETFYLASNFHPRGFGFTGNYVQAIVPRCSDGVD